MFNELHARGQELKLSSLHMLHLEEPIRTRRSRCESVLTADALPLRKPHRGGQIKLLAGCEPARCHAVRRRGRGCAGNRRKPPEKPKETFSQDGLYACRAGGSHVCASNRFPENDSWEFSRLQTLSRGNHDGWSWANGKGTNDHGHVGVLTSQMGMELIRKSSGLVLRAMAQALVPAKGTRIEGVCKIDLFVRERFG